MIQAFYVLLFSACFFLVYALSTTGAPLPGKWHLWQNLLLLALVPTVVSNLTLVLAIKEIGSTMTSILGSMEPLTAVLVGVLHFGEKFGLDSASGLILISHGGHHRQSSGQEKRTSANPPARKHPLASAVTAAEETFRQGATDYRSFFSGRLGNHPFSTRLRCSNNSPILQNEEAPQTANKVDQTMFSTSTEPMTAAIPIRRKIHQIRTPK